MRDVYRTAAAHFILGAFAVGDIAIRRIAPTRIISTGDGQLGARLQHHFLPWNIEVRLLPMEIPVGNSNETGRFSILQCINPNRSAHGMHVGP